MSAYVQPMNAVPLKPRRPFGVTVVALMQGIASPTAGISLFLADTPLGISRAYERTSDLAAWVLSAIGIVIAIGLWRLTRWAWVCTMIWFGFTMAGSLLAYRQGQAPYWLMVISIITVFYLNQRDVQLAFRHRRPDGDARASGVVEPQRA